MFPSPLLYASCIKQIAKLQIESRTLFVMRCTSIDITSRDHVYNKDKKSFFVLAVSWFSLFLFLFACIISGAATKAYANAKVIIYQSCWWHKSNNQSCHCFCEAHIVHSAGNSIAPLFNWRPHNSRSFLICVSACALFYIEDFDLCNIYSDHRRSVYCVITI